MAHLLLRHLFFRKKRFFYLMGCNLHPSPCHNFTTSLARGGSTGGGARGWLGGRNAPERDEGGGPFRRDAFALFIQGEEKGAGGWRMPIRHPAPFLIYDVE